MHREFPVVAFLAALLLLLPLPWHWRARNVATLSMILWLFVINVIYGVDAIIWGNNVNVVVPVWCDITSKIIIGATFALPSACLCVCIHLERVASVRQAQTTHSDKRRRQIFEAIMCFGLPMLFMGLHYIVQGHRFDIIEEYGCRPTTYVSIPAVFLIWVPPLLLATLSLGFAAAAFMHFMRRRITFARHLESSRNGLTTTRYFRLMLMAVVEMVWNILVTAYTLWFSMLGARPWTNWDDVHSNFSRIDLYITAFTPQIVITNYYLVWWVVPASTFIFVAFFAFGKDAIDEYKACFVWFRRTVLRQTVLDSTPGSFGSLPVTHYPRDVTSSVPSVSTMPSYKASSPTKDKDGFDDIYLPSINQSDYGAPISSPAPAYQARAYGSVEDLHAPPTPSTLPSSSYASSFLTDVIDISRQNSLNGIEPHQIV
ncbi:pheromone A receptor-domain-containing protein [Hygrophoropsis aurantiaca]|uniref:Pheromone A receptor-domain-containing protein n=1 Tax=Hygrophoropsis aurantiaca TaxID=72124 RepID=A0ACB8AF98_9AGAM|nr:pheromone A receptor-domain-containing protein [Hygrophoropsis aurantiaca]